MKDSKKIPSFDVDDFKYNIDKIDAVATVLIKYSPDDFEQTSFDEVAFDFGLSIRESCKELTMAVKEFDQECRDFSNST